MNACALKKGCLGVASGASDSRRHPSLKRRLRAGGSPLASLTPLLTSLCATLTSHRTPRSATFAPRQTPFHPTCAPLLTPLSTPYAALLTPFRAGLRRGSRCTGWSRLLRFLI